MANGNRWGVALLIFVALPCGLLIGTVMPGRGAISNCEMVGDAVGALDLGASEHACEG